MTDKTAHYKNVDNKSKKDMLLRFDGFLDGVDEPKRSMLRSIISDYVEYCSWTDDLKRRINNEGFLIDGRENPLIGIMHKMGSRKADYYAKITRALKDELSEEDVSALESFLDA